MAVTDEDKDAMNDWLNYYIGRSLGLENVEDIGDRSIQFAAPWAQTQGHFWLMLACAIVVALSALFYFKGHVRGRGGVRFGLGVFRATVLVLLVLILAEPSLRVTITSKPAPTLMLLVDGTESMDIRDEYETEFRKRLDAAVGRSTDAETSTEKPSRMQYIQAWLKSNPEALTELAKKYRLQACVFDRTDGVRSLSVHRPGESEFDPTYLAEQLEIDEKAPVTALADAFRHLLARQATSSLQGVVVFSDFAENGNTTPTGTAGAPVDRMAAKGVKFYTVGLGATEAIDLRLTNLDVPPAMKRAERTSVTVRLSQKGLEGRTAVVKLRAEPVDASLGATTIDLGQKTVQLPAASVEFSFVPEQSGRFKFIAEVVPFDDEISTDDNYRSRIGDIRDDFLRLMAVEYEPTWEWRFIKEVFHRDKLVGMRGFRTFLRSADPQVRINNPLFHATLTPERSEFFKTDVIFLGDMPAASLSPEFCAMTKEFVTKFGGGLVVMAGPRFGPGELADTELASILPVHVSAGEQLRDGEFRLQLTSEAADHGFMKLGEGEGIDSEAWDNLGELPWYQPVVRKHEDAIVLAEHPTDVCPNTNIKQPLIAIRRFPASGGNVVYIGFNEMWRLRRRFGEKYYTAFWGGLIKKLALSNSALGAEKRFVPRTDRTVYRLDDRITLTVNAYDEQYKPLTEDGVDGGALTAELEIPGDAGAPPRTVIISIPYREDGVFETENISADVPGTYRLRVRDPVSKEMMVRTFEVTNVSAERRRAIRDTKIETAIAAFGKKFDLTTVANLPDEIELESRTEVTPRVIALGSTWPVLLLVSLLMLGEWTFRKLNNMA
jgi:hypothetical protein